MKSTILAVAAIAAALFVTPAIAATDCSKLAPYYHTTHADSPGSLLADLFFLPMTAAVAVIASPTAVPYISKKTKDAKGDTVYFKVLCGPINHGKRLMEKGPQAVPKVIKNFN